MRSLTSLIQAGAVVFAASSLAEGLLVGRELVIGRIHLSLRGLGVLASRGRDG